MSVTLSVSGGALAVPTAGVTVTVTGNGTNALVVAGTTASVNAALGGLVFTPTADFNRAARLTVAAADAGGLQSTAMVSLTVTPVNDPPVGVTDAFGTDLGVALTVTGSGVLTNDRDRDRDRDSLTATVVAGPTNGTLVLQPDGSFVFTPAAGFFGTDSFTYTVGDGTAAGDPVTVTLAVAETPAPPPLPPPLVPLERQFAVGSGAGESPRVTLYNADGSVRRTVTPFDPSFTGGVRVAVADVTGDGVPDVVIVPGTGGAPRLRVIDGATGSPLADFNVYEESFRGGLYVALGDVNADGKADIITGTGNGGAPRVRVLDGASLGRDVLRDFFAYEQTFRGGVRVGGEDVNGDGRDEVITHVRRGNDVVV